MKNLKNMKNIANKLPGCAAKKCAYVNSGRSVAGLLSKYSINWSISASFVDVSFVLLEVVGVHEVEVGPVLVEVLNAMLRDVRCFDRVAAAALANFDEGGEEVVHAIAQLLHVGVLIGRAFVSVDRDALVDGLAIEIELFSERLHDELLEVFAEEDEAVFVGKDDHVFFAFTVAGVVPSEGELHGGIF